jgi:hypothetical protein
LGGACFHGDGVVQLESGMSKRLSELAVGDRILTSEEGEFSFSPVTILPHSVNSEPASFLNLTTDSGKTVEMTSDHLLPKCNDEVTTAGSLVVGDCLFTIDGKETLTSITSSAKLGVYTAVTDRKFIVVNGIVASPHSENSDVNQPEMDYERYRLELEMQRQRDVLFSRKSSDKRQGLRGEH